MTDVNLGDVVEALDPLVSLIVYQLRTLGTLRRSAIGP